MKHRISILLSSVVLIGTAFARGPVAAPATGYTRLIKAGSTETLQTRAVRFVPAVGDGPVVWLIGVAHIGQSDYYKSIQKLLDAQTLVLFEGVKQGEARKKQGDMSSTYRMLSDALGLAFQLNAVDYKRTHFSQQPYRQGGPRPGNDPHRRRDCLRRLCPAPAELMKGIYDQIACHRRPRIWSRRFVFRFRRREDGHARGSAYDLRRLPPHGKGEPPGRAGRHQRRGVGRGQDGRGDLRR